MKKQALIHIYQVMNMCRMENHMSLGTDYIFMVLMTSLMAKDFVKMTMWHGQLQLIIWLIGDMKELYIKRRRILTMQMEIR